MIELATRPTGDEPAREDGELHLSLTAAPSALSEVRAELGRFLDRNQVGDEAFYNALLVAHELAANAIRHGSDPGDRIEVTAHVLGRRLCLTVSDAARRGRSPVALTPDDARENGRGLQIVDRLADWSERIVDARRELSAELTL